MASAASEIDPAAEPQVVVVVDESSTAVGSEEGAEAPAVEVAIETGAAKEEEEGECGFCLYMKGGACKEAFVSWEECVEAAGSDMVERCAEATGNLMRCMTANTDYYGPVLEAEKHASDKAEAAIANAEEPAPSPATDEAKKEEAVAESAPSGAHADEEVVQQDASSTAEEEAVVEKVESLSLGN